MKIEVRNYYEDNVVFVGDAEEFLETECYNEDLENILEDLDGACVGDTMQYEEYIIEKIFGSIYE